MRRRVIRMLNKAIHMTGCAFIVFGILMAVKAAGMCDLDGDIAEMSRYARVGAISALGGGFIGRWNV